MADGSMPLAGAGTASVGRVAADALRWQRNLALLIVVTPMLGVLGAGYLAYTSGVSIIDIALLLVMYVASVIGVEAGFHRHFTHRAFAAHPTVRALLAILGSTAAQGPVLFWAAMHREHHAHSDRPGDPHSPRASSEGVMAAMRGLCHAHVLWLFKPLPQDFAARVPDLLRDGFVFRLHRNYPWWVILGLVLPALLGGLLTQSWRGALSGFLWGGLVRVFLVHHATWSVNSLCHSFGSRPFNTGDRSTNNPLLVLSSLGGCWHNNHHAFPTLARLDFRWWQLDICGWFIRLLQIAGLAWNVRVVDKRTLGLRATTDATKRQGESP